MVRSRSVAALALASVLAAACTRAASVTSAPVTASASTFATSTSTSTVPPPISPTTTSATTTPPATTTPTAPAPRPVTVAFGGDVYGETPVREVLARGENPLSAVAPLLRAADVSVVNLETSIGTSGEPRDKQFVFQSSPAILGALRDAGVDAVSVANNHSFDHGLDGFLETLRNVDGAGLRSFGGGANAPAAYAPAIFDVGGVRIALVGIAVVGPDAQDRAGVTIPGTTNGRDQAATLRAIEAARKITPIVIVMVHWGVEMAPCPRPFERSFANQMLAAGASAIVGAHPHVLQGISYSDGQLVAYSLGNFVFAGVSDAARSTGVLTLTLSPDGKVESYAFDPARIDGNGQPIPLVGAAQATARGALAALDPDGAFCRDQPPSA
jgi:poly-gamma-glutamate capsule biosynthesis protein CapA/YwtB (metallophosphatase superfamily)